MTKKGRSILFFALVLVFAIIAPGIILYSQGYRFDIKEMKFLKTGGIYVKAYPSGVNVSIDGKYKSTTSSFSRDLLVQNLFPASHAVKLEKTGYRSWEKSLKVEETKVAEAKFVILFSDDIPFESISKDITGFYPYSSQNKIILTTSKGLFLYNEDNGQTSQIASSSLNIADIIFSGNDSNAIVKTASGAYYLLPLSSKTPALTQIKSLNSKATNISFDSNNDNVIYYQSNSQIYELDLSKKTSPALFRQNAVQSFYLYGDSIYSFENGDVYTSNTIINSSTKITQSALPFLKSNTYKLTVMEGEVFLIENGRTAYHLNRTSGSFEKMFESSGEIKYTPFYDRILFASNNELLVYLVKDVQSPFFKPAGSLIYITRFSQKIDDIKWLNADYFIYTINNKLWISEIDNRDNINAFEVDGISPSKIYFNGNVKKIFVLDGTNFTGSNNKIIP
jgi:hypothetical protein